MTSDLDQPQPDSTARAPEPEQVPEPAAAAEPMLAEPLAPAPRRNRWLDVALGAAVVVAVAGIAFAAGRLTAPAEPAFAGRNITFGGPNAGKGPNASLAPGETPGPGLRVGPGGSFTLQGSIVEVTADHLTIKLDSGQTVQVPLDSSTAYHRQAAASSSDVQPGERVLVQLETPSGSGGSSSGRLPPASNVTVLSQ